VTLFPYTTLFRSRVSRRETSANLGIAVALALGYYFLTVAVNWLDRQPDLRPDLLLWLPNVALVLLAAWLFSRLERR
jgi:lipopolysaccharide export system permease protein